MSSSSLRVRMVVPVMALSWTACGDASSGHGRDTVRDSGGIAIVENGSAGDAQAVRLGVEPSLTIGGLEAEAEYQLFRVRAATRLSDGRVALFDGGSNELRFYDPNGRFLDRIGGKGQGPGEFQRVGWMHAMPGDSVVVFDQELRRTTVVGPDGEVARTASLESQPIATPTASTIQFNDEGQYEILGPLGDGTFVGRTQDRPPTTDPGSGASETRRSVTYVRLAPDGSLLERLGALPGSELETSVADGPIKLVSVTPRPFGRTSYAALDDEGFWFGDGEAFEVRHYTASGTVDRIVRWDGERVRVTPALQEAGLDAELAEIPGDGPAQFRDALQRVIEEKWSRADLPATLPAHGELRVDRSGRLWVEETAFPDRSDSHWLLFDRNGGLLGRATLPPRFRPLEIGRDYVLGVAEDEYEVERVQIHPLTAGS